jgi:putative DNA methylase
VAAVVVKVLRERAAEGKYDLGSWVLMPNHVHVLLKPGDTIPRGIAWIKGPTAFEANRVMKRSGCLWAKDYFDRWIRNRNEWENPVWQWSSAHLKRD